MILAAKGAAAASGLPYQWVAVGAAGALATSTSTTASSWTARTSSFGTDLISGVASDGAAFYVAVGAAGKLATSPDGITWTQRTSSFGTSTIQGIAYGGGYWVAVGADGKVAYATNPTGTWTQATTGFSASVLVTSITYGNGLWVAINVNGEIRTAPDPTGSWTLRTSTLTLSASYGGIRWHAAQDVFTAGCDQNVTTGAFASSTNGTTWTARNSPVTTSNGTIDIAVASFISNSSIIVVHYRTGATGATSDIASSTDGATWTDRTPAITTNWVGQGAADQQGLLVFPSNANTLQTSSDGSTWTSRTGPTFAQNSICHSSGTPV